MDCDVTDVIVSRQTQARGTPAGRAEQAEPKEKKPGARGSGERERVCLAVQEYICLNSWEAGEAFLFAL